MMMIIIIIFYYRSLCYYYQPVCSVTRFNCHHPFNPFIAIYLVFAIAINSNFKIFSFHFADLFINWKYFHLIILFGFSNSHFLLPLFRLVLLATTTTIIIIKLITITI
jgi:hypothetical protein